MAGRQKFLKLINSISNAKEIPILTFGTIEGKCTDLYSLSTARPLYEGK